LGHLTLCWQVFDLLSFSSAQFVLLQSELDISGNIVTLSAFERKCYEFTATEFWGGGKG
jgi:hypothetical protein